MKRLLAEGFGTFVIVLAGTGAMVVDAVSGGRVTHAGVSLAFGVAVAAMILSLRGVSGAHLNPAVTIGFVAAERFPRQKALAYVAAQCAGAIAASLLLEGIFPARAAAGASLPAGSALQSFGLETAMTFVLMLVILGVSAGSRWSPLGVALAIGAVVGLEAFFGGPISGASMNPARSLAPAIVSGRLESLWIYLLAPTLGAVLAVPACRRFGIPGCCAESAESRAT